MLPPNHHTEEVLLVSPSSSILFPYLTLYISIVLITESESEVAQLRLIVCDPMDCSLPGSSVHGIFQARILEWGAISLVTRKLKSSAQTPPRNSRYLQVPTQNLHLAISKITQIQHVQYPDPNQVFSCFLPIFSTGIQKVI